VQTAVEDGRRAGLVVWYPCLALALAHAAPGPSRAHSVISFFSAVSYVRSYMGSRDTGKQPAPRTRRPMALLLAAVAATTAAAPRAVELRPSSAGIPRRTYDGIGGLSGGGATSTFLQSYPEPQRSLVLDAMFKPGAGASLDILKVEIASDDQTTDGCEAGHWRRAEEAVNCSRGYEWALMKEAVARNPSIQLYGLPWTWAGWLADPKAEKPSPYFNVSASADYITRWVSCARDAHGLNISLIGLWK
jgi:hypothetical protein